MRDKLIELLEKKYDHYCDQCGVNKQSHYLENLADYLIANGVTLQQWIPTSEWLPEMEERVLAWNDKGLVQMCRFETRYSIKSKCLKTGFYTDGNKKAYAAKYWMSIPNTPKGETK